MRTCRREVLMINVVHENNRRQYSELLDRQFRLRHEIFVKERGWAEFETDGIYEKDAYDNNSAIYLIAADELGKVAGGFRLYLTVLPHMLTEQLKILTDYTVQKHVDHFVVTRIAVPRT